MLIERDAFGLLGNSRNQYPFEGVRMELVMFTCNEAWTAEGHSSCTWSRWPMSSGHISLASLHQTIDYLVQGTRWVQRRICAIAHRCCELDLYTIRSIYM